MMWQPTTFYQAPAMIFFSTGRGGGAGVAAVYLIASELRLFLPAGAWPTADRRRRASERASRQLTTAASQLDGAGGAGVELFAAGELRFLPPAVAMPAADHTAAAAAGPVGASEAAVELEAEELRFLLPDHAAAASS